MKRNMTNLRAAARSTRNLPTLSQVEIAKRWDLDADTVRKIMAPLRIPPVHGPWKRSRYSIQDVWRIEGIAHSQITEQALHAELLKPLETADIVAPRYRCVPATILNWAREGRIPCARLGGSVRFHSFTVPGVPDVV